MTKPINTKNKNATPASGSDPHGAFEEYLKAHDGRYTTQKREIATEIFNTKDHFEVEIFIDKIRAKNKKVSRATVYRTIKQLLSAGLLQKIATQDGKVYYEKSITKKQHDHVICNTCGKILEIFDNKLDKVIEKLCQDIGITPDYRSLHIYGECESLKKTGRCQYKHKNTKVKA